MGDCMAHRGWSGKAPENTVAAFQLVWDSPEIVSFELDVQLSKDGIPVVIHDFTLERTTNGSGWVKDYTFEELQQLDAGKWFDESFANERIPSLDQILKLNPAGCKINIELKTAGNMYKGLAEKVVGLVKGYGMERDVYITSFDHEVIREVNTLDSSLETGLILIGKPTLLKEQLEETGAIILSMSYPYLTKVFVDEMYAKGYKVIAWTVDEKNAIKEMMKWHPELTICTNHPDLMIQEISHHI
ncbi:glycerophosphodiester phosphodiesterase [Brevibacillus daliensis]|uniref:glycerophosphodiester phosphodiesterase n=1 Tax=Brevibacillus daliensis TaxID=2892995 RepID=UPI001E34213C|nr:glycerophosphodiester phosphodiesterase family protein [Brevibacillus daliensis]